MKYFGSSATMTRKKMEHLSFNENSKASDLVDLLIIRYGTSFKRLFYDKDGEMKPLVMLFVNGKAVEDYSIEVTSGDEVSIAPLIAGG